MKHKLMKIVSIGLMIVQLTAQKMGYVTLTAHVIAIAAGLGSCVIERLVLQTVLGMENAIWNYPSVSAMNPILVCAQYIWQ